MIPEYPRLALDKIQSKANQNANNDYISLKESINSFKQKFTNDVNFLPSNSSVESLSESPRLLARNHTNLARYKPFGICNNEPNRLVFRKQILILRGLVNVYLFQL